MIHDDHVTELRRVSFSSREVDEVTDHIARTYVGNTTRFGTVHGPAGFIAESVDAGAIAADRSRCSVDYRTTTEPWGFFCSVVVTHGTILTVARDGELLLRAGDTSVLPLGVPLEFAATDQGCLMVRMPLTRLEAAAETLGTPGGQLRLAGFTPISPTTARYWRSVVGLVNGSLLDDESPMRSVLLREELARMTALAALHVFPNTTMDQHHVPGPGHVAPAVVRRAVAHIEAHAGQPLTVADIAAASGTGARALQQAFRRHLGTTPMEHLRRVRLERAHRELQAADARRGDTVSAIAARWGFLNAGRFATEHRAAYGEPPSQTLRT